ncbi:MAG: TIGR00269 family protein [Candidatus Odinarchaeia archaeon]
MTKCFYCENEAAVYRRYSGEYLCKNCFIRSIERKVKRTINKYNMLTETDRIAVGVSGGKDSLTLLKILTVIERKFPETEIIAVTIDEGIKNYREEALDFARKTASRLGVEHVVYSFKELFGFTLDEMVMELKELNTDIASPCSYCGVLRRTALNIAARKVKATKLAVAHNLDDESQTALMNFIRADFMRLLRTGPVLNFLHENFVTKIKPLTEIPEKEVVLYAYFRGLPLHSQSCPYAPEAMRNDIRNFLNEMEAKRPEVKYNILKITDRIRSQISKTQVEVGVDTCIECGEPTTQNICKTCRFLKLIRDKKKFNSQNV